METEYCTVKLVPLGTSDDLPAVTACKFCDQQQRMTDDEVRACERLSGGRGYFCTFCLRNGFHTRRNRHILPLSFRAVPGYYYLEYYKNQKGRMWLSEIWDYIYSHAEVGLTSPAWEYDPATFMWFIDFAKVGAGRHHVRLDDVLRMTINILTCFNLSQNINLVRPQTFLAKYTDAIRSFYTKRYRPPGRRLLIPTFTGCGVVEKDDVERTRFFTAADLKMIK
jgi:hypothetical protein